MHEPGAFNLGQVQRYLRRRGLGLLILDAYRPVRATRGARALGGANRARRRRGHVHRPPQPPQHGQRGGHHLVRFRDGKRLRMGGFALGPSSHTYNASGRILRNRLTLKNAMERFGFSAYLTEWWHFEHHIRPDRYLDVTLGCGLRTRDN